MANREQKVEKVRDAVKTVVSLAAMASSSVVIELAIKAITPPALRPITKIGLKVGGLAIDAILGAAAGNAAAQMVDNVDMAIQIVDEAMEKVMKAKEEETEEAELVTV